MIVGLVEWVKYLIAFDVADSKTFKVVVKRRIYTFFYTIRNRMLKIKMKQLFYLKGVFFFQHNTAQHNTTHPISNEYFVRFDWDQAPPLFGHNILILNRAKKSNLWSLTMVKLKIYFDVEVSSVSKFVYADLRSGQRMSTDAQVRFNQKPLDPGQNPTGSFYNFIRQL